MQTAVPLQLLMEIHQLNEKKSHLYQHSMNIFFMQFLLYPLQML